MYKFLLCTRYLQTRFLAFVCIVSVMLGNSTLIVVNSVMSGFATKLKDRLHGISADASIDTERFSGFSESPDSMTARIMASPAGRHVEAVSPTVEVFGMLQFRRKDRSGEDVVDVKKIMISGVDPAKHAKVGGFSQYLTRQKNRPNPSFDLTQEARERYERNRALDFPDFPANPSTAREPKPDFFKDPIVVPQNPLAPPPTIAPPVLDALPPPKPVGIVLGYSLAHYRYTDPHTNEVKEIEVIKPGDHVMIVTLGVTGDAPVSRTFVVVDYFQSQMSEYDSMFVYVPLDELQKMRGMGDKINSLQMKFRPDSSQPLYMKQVLVPELQKLFPPPDSRVSTWQDKQSVLLAAIDVERGLLNLLLFLIVGVAGFGILAIFTMIVSEKYRDIGIMKSLGASSGGVMSIFLGYGFLLGAVGCILGTGLGLAITKYINPLESFLTKLTGTALFPRDVYYFDAIPTNVDTLAVALVNIGAIAVAVIFSVLPALRAARLHPVRALRFE
ncbi:MAG TPA: FtsX-like permease family protein [Fimbriiglobus sp.]